ncbi:MAG TPA: MarC family protein [Actinomycetes bacterium]|nr:MarC family protein [Actinomycetes bacterium]
MSSLLDPTFFGTAFVTLFVIIDPPGSVPLFLALTANQTGGQRARSALRAVLVSFAVIVAFAIFGSSILRYLDISLPALQGAGGLLLLLVSLELLTGMGSSAASTEPDVDVALVPLGTPLLAGPGAIVATMVAVRQAGGAGEKLAALALAIVAVHVVIWLVLRFSGAILQVLRDGGISILTRIAGLLLSAIAVQLVADSVIAFAKSA